LDDLSPELAKPFRECWRIEWNHLSHADEAVERLVDEKKWDIEGGARTRKVCGGTTGMWASTRLMWLALSRLVHAAAQQNKWSISI
jgi:hypothetical protein